VSTTGIPTMIVEDVELRVQPSLTFHGDPINCDHFWKPDLCETGQVCCSRCRSRARWVNDPWARGEVRS
jgi:hypothetical protein